MRTLAIQQALKAKGFDPGPLDGAMGPLTRKAIAAFEAKVGLKPDGAPDAELLKALLGSPSAAPYPPWLEEAERRKGLHETRDKRALVDFLRSDGATVGDPTRLPWCGDFVETCIARTLPDEPLPANPYLARNWLRFGAPCTPTLGAVLIFWRGSKAGTSGHVGFYAGEDKTAFHVLGGNQGNAVGVARIARARLLGARWPRTVPIVEARRIEASESAGLSRDEA